jgi:RNA polymerase sigma-70 factor, ECF subfamily
VRKRRPRRVPRHATFDADVAERHTILVHYGFKLTHDGEEAKDLAQATIVKALAWRAHYREQGRMSSWLCTILYNLFVNRCRERRREGSHVPVDEVFDGSTNEWVTREHGSIAVAGEQMGSELRRDLVQGLTRLSSEKREVLLMATYEGMTYDEMAEQIGIPVGTVRSRLARARSLMREFLGAPAKQVTSLEHCPGKRARRPQARRQKKAAVAA